MKINKIYSIILCVLLGAVSSFANSDKDDPQPPVPGQTFDLIASPKNASSFGIGRTIEIKAAVANNIRCIWSIEGNNYVKNPLKYIFKKAGTYTIQLQTTLGSQSVTVNVFPAPVIKKFGLSASRIQGGQKVKLDWRVDRIGNTSSRIDPGFGGVKLEDSAWATPSGTTTYTLTASNDSGTVTATCTVVVNQPPVLATTINLADIPALTPARIELPAASDANGDGLGYAVKWLPYGLVFNATSRTIEGTPISPGVFFLQYTAWDSNGGRCSRWVRLRIQPKEEKIPDGFTTYTHYDYDGQGRLSELTYPSGRGKVGYAYTPLDQVKEVTWNGKPLISSIKYDDWSNPQRRIYASGAMDTWAYDASGTRVKQWVLGLPGEGAVPEAKAYSYDAADRLTEAGEWSSLEYDANGRLTTAAGFGLVNKLEHDAFNNNIHSATTGSAVPDTLNHFTFNPMVDNHLPGVAKNGGLTGVQETNFGEITNLATGISASTTLAMGWDSLGRMTSTRRNETGATQSYEYAASGLRVTRTDSLNPDQDRLYAYTGSGNLLSIFSGTTHPVPSRDVVYLGSLAVAEIDSDANTYELHSDHLGTPRTITLATDGAVVGRQAYGPYGELLTNQTSGYVPLTGYTGHIQTESTGLIYMRGRFYSPAWHRFMNSDQGVDPNSINQFGYVCGNPLISTDPTGLQEFGPNANDIAVLHYQAVVAQTGSHQKGLQALNASIKGSAAGVVTGATVLTGAVVAAEAPGALAVLGEWASTKLGQIKEILTKSGNSIAQLLSRGSASTATVTAEENAFSEAIGSTLKGMQSGGTNFMEAQVKTSQGTVNIGADIVVNGKTLKLDSLCVYAENGTISKGSVLKEMLKAKQQLMAAAKQLGFEKLEIVAERAANSSSANPGKTIEQTVELH